MKGYIESMMGRRKDGHKLVMLYPTMLGVERAGNEMLKTWYKNLREPATNKQNRVMRRIECRLLENTNFKIARTGR